MFSKFSIIVLLFAALIAPCAHAATASSDDPVDGQVKNWWEDSPWVDPDRGFNWYPDPQVVKPKEPEAEKQKPKNFREMKTLEELSAELKRLKDRAIMNPTRENVHEFLQAQDFVMTKSSVFADVAQRVIFEQPDVNYGVRSPVANFARANERTRQEKRTRENIQNLSETHGILFFARSDCPYCHDQAPVLKWVSQTMGIDVMAISMDGGPIPQFPDAKLDNGISRSVTGGGGITTVPAVYLLNRETNEAIPLGTGVVAGEELAERIWIMTRTKPGERF